MLPHFPAHFGLQSGATAVHNMQSGLKLFISYSDSICDGNLFIPVPSGTFHVILLILPSKRKPPVWGGSTATKTCVVAWPWSVTQLSQIFITLQLLQNQRGCTNSGIHVFHFLHESPCHLHGCLLLLLFWGGVPKQLRQTNQIGHGHRTWCLVG